MTRVMTNNVVNELTSPWFLPFPHRALLKFAEGLTDEQLAHRPSPTSPPIGWHIFHVARWADRLQASFPNHLPEDSHSSALPRQIWSVENLATAWSVRPETLGWLETGAGMAVDQATVLASVGQVKLIDYASRAFTAADQAVAKLHDHELQEKRYSIIPEMKVSSSTQAIETTGPRTVTVLFDLLFHLSHVSRHLGMVEALRGALFAISGTASV